MRPCPGREIFELLDGEDADRFVSTVVIKVSAESTVIINLIIPYILMRLSAKAIIIENDSILLIEYKDKTGLHYNFPGGG